MASHEASASPITSNGSRKRPRSSRDPIQQNNVSCSRCKEKKIKCDTETPACRPCSRAGANCTIVDSSLGRKYTRSQINSLHEQIQGLEKHLQTRGVVEPDHPQHSVQNVESRNISGNLPLRNTQTGHIPKFIGEESGTGFIQYILHAISRGWKDTSFPQPAQEGVSGPAVINHPAHPLPSLSEGGKLVTAFLAGFHIQHTFLQRSEVHALYERVYQRQSTARLRIGDKHDFFQLNLIFALASVDEYRKGRSEKHPFGYFTAGLQNLNGIMSFETLKDVQGFLLVAHFGLSYYIGCSIWEICQICLRICIEQGLHKAPRSIPENLLAEQMRRRIFWNCYQLDRLSSVTLGRPFGIEDDDIEIDLPFDAEDDYLEKITQWAPDEVSSLTGLSSSNGEVAVFNCSIRLGRVACRIHTSLNFGFSEELQRRKTTVGYSSHRGGSLEPGDTYQLFRDFFLELRSWRLSCPVFVEPQCPTQTQDWFQFMYEREKLTLIRAVIDRMHSRSSFPPKELLYPCHNTAAAIIHKYNALRQRDQVSYSWSYMQLLLTCGLSVIFCVFVKFDGRQREHSQLERSWLSHRWTDLEPETFRDFSLQESSTAIDACASIHSWMAEQCKEMGRYARFYNMMRRGIQEKIKQVGTRNQSSAQPESTRPQLMDQENVPGQHPTTAQSNNQYLGINIDNVMNQQSHFNNSDYAQQDNGTFEFLGQQNFDSSISQLPQSNWSGTDSENTFEPLVRQFFGADPGFHLEDIEFGALLNDFSGWDFSHDPLLAEFTSGLEGFM